MKRNERLDAIISQIEEMKKEGNVKMTLSQELADYEEKLAEIELKTILDSYSKDFLPFFEEFERAVKYDILYLSDIKRIYENSETPIDFGNITTKSARADYETVSLKDKRKGLSLCFEENTIDLELYIAVDKKELCIKFKKGEKYSQYDNAYCEVPYRAELREDVIKFLEECKNFMMTAELVLDSVIDREERQLAEHEEKISALKAKYERDIAEIKKKYNKER